MEPNDQTLPGQGLKPEKMPGHWLLAQMGKRVLRPGGLELTRRMSDALAIRASDHVVEFAPGLGATARLTLRHDPASYTAVERDDAAAAIVRRFLHGDHQKCVVGHAEETGLADDSATVVYGEAMLSMQTADTKSRIIREAVRLLRPGGRYAIHELCLVPDDLAEAVKDEIHQSLSAAIHAGVRPLTAAEWRELLEAEGLSVKEQAQSPMHLLEPKRLVQDEGLFGAVRFVWNVARHKEARRRVFAMRGVFRKYRDHLAAIMLVGQKTEGAAS
jgi:SAM-dependent methyltransferase